MVRTALRTTYPLLATALLSAAAVTPVQAQETDGIAVTEQTVIDRCSRCHAADEDGRMSRISYMRKTPEGWQTSIRRMVALHGARLSQSDAVRIARYLANEHGVAPEELRPGMFEVERRMLEHDWDGDSDVEFTCIQCHSMGRVMTQRRTEEEWALLLDTHRALYPLVDFQAFRYGGPASQQDDPRHPMDRAISHLGEIYPLETDAWTEWAATKRSPRLAGDWVLSGYEPGKGVVYGQVSITADPADRDAFTTASRFVYPQSGEMGRRRGQSLVYTGYQWRGRNSVGTPGELREVLFVERDQQEMWGRWYRGDYDEFGPDVRLQRVIGPTVAGVYPHGIVRGSEAAVTVYGAQLSSELELDFGSGITVGSIAEGPLGIEVTIRVDPDAAVGPRDLFAGSDITERAIVVHDGIDRIEVTPRTGMARNGGANFPKGFQTFDAIAYDDGPDGESGTDDDLRIGRVEASWHMEEYAATFGDDDIDFVGALGQDGVFDPADDGPNPNRSGNRNNIGDVWAVATYTTPEGDELTARAHLVVTVPLYLRFDPWRPIDDGRAVGQNGGSR